MTTPTVSSRAGDILSPDQLDLLRSLLLCELAEQIDQRDRSRARIEELTGLTDTDSSFLRELADSAAGHAEAVVRDVRHALLRFGDGTYGRCERCDDTIPLERLEAIPYARLCVACVGTAPGRIR